MSYNIDRAEGFLHTFLLAEISPEIEAFNSVLNRNLMDLSNKIIGKIFTTVSDRDLCKPSSTTREWNTSDGATLCQSHIHIHNVFREALRTANPEAIASTSQCTNHLLQSLTRIDPIEFVQQMVEECPELRSSFSTSFLHDNPLTMVWGKLKEQNPGLDLPNCTTANAIRQWIKTEDAKQILSLIKKLDLSHCNLLVLPSEIGQLAHLQELSLEGNQLKDLPPEIGELADLKKLYLGKNQLTSLPDTIGKLAALKVLHLEENQLTSLPDTIERLTSLQHLRVESNQLTSLPATIGKLATLEVLSLSLNQLTSLPTEIGKLVALKMLFLDRNQFTSLPATIGKLVALQRLFLWENQLTSLPATIRQLATLRLFLSEDQLLSLHQGTFPPEIGQLAALQKRLERNQLASLPLEIEKLAALQKLHRESTHPSSRPRSKKTSTIG